MNCVFIGGSRKLLRLNDSVRRRLENIIEKNLRVLVGDANGSDKAVQKFFLDRNYENVTVYCMEGGCRNNLGSWAKREVSSGRPERGSRYYALKDAAMASDASCGFMIWDGRSKGTLNNVLNLLHDGKVSVLRSGPRILDQGIRWKNSLLRDKRSSHEEEQNEAQPRVQGESCLGSDA